MNQFRKEFALFGKLSRADQMDQFRNWSSEMRVPKPPQTKPTRPTISPVSPEQTRRSSARLASGQTEVEENCGGVHDGGDLAVDEEDNSAEGDVLVLQQIGLEEKLLEVWEHGPPQLAEQQLLRISEEMVEELRTQLVERNKIIQEQQIKIDTFRKADQVSKELSLSMAQKMLTDSNLALFSKQKKTKLVTAHSVSYITTKPRPEVKDEMAMAMDREMKRRQAMQKEEITVLVATVDRISARYDRYTNVSTIINMSEPRSEVVPDHLFSWMDSHLVALWVYAVEPTLEEFEKYEKYMDKQMRPDPIYSPTLPKARVNWHRLNPNIKRNLPMPVQYPLHGCALDPEFYTTMGEDVYYLGQKMDPRLLFVSGHPFGELYGFWTSKGVLSPPDEPVGGYHCCPETGTWIIAAEGG